MWWSFDDSYRDLLEIAVDGRETDFGIALVVVLEVDAAVVQRPLGTRDVTIEFFGEGMRTAAVASHQVELGCLVTLIAIVEACIGDPFSVGGNDGIVVGTFARGQLANRSVGD